MRIVATYSLKRGREFLEKSYPDLLREIEEAITSVDASKHKTKESEEATMRGEMLYSPPSLNAALKKRFHGNGWRTRRVRCEYSTKFYEQDYKPAPLRKGAFREIDYVKGKVGVEVQFGKYAFMVYNVCAKMTIFHNEGIIDSGVEVVPVKNFANEMASGVSYFEQMVWDMEHRGAADIDIPVLILGIDVDPRGHWPVQRRVPRPTRPRKGARPGPKPRR